MADDLRSRRVVIGGFRALRRRRYLRAKRKQAVISVITVISILGVAAGVMALVIALAINNGFRDTLQRNLLGATAHVSILEKEPGDGIERLARTRAEAVGSCPRRRARRPSLVWHTCCSRGPSAVHGRNPERRGPRPQHQTEMLAHLKQGSIAR